MIVTKCDICGKEMPSNSSRYKVYFDGWLDKEDKDICVSCFERIKEEIVRANTSHTEKKYKEDDVIRVVDNVKHGYGLTKSAKDIVAEIQADCETCNHNGEYAYCRLCGSPGEDNYEPQTEGNE